MKAVAKNFALVVASILVSLALFEIVLVLTGTYKELASQDLRLSPAIWERPRNAVERHRHPDLKVPIEIVYDDDGVRNHDRVSTSAKRNIVGFFGDSFTENRRIENRFTFVRLLDELAGGKFRMVNFGVDAYGVDQNYLRYLKYRHLDIHTVVYVLCENDLRNLYEAGITTLGADGKVKFLQPRANRTLRILGKFRTPYVAISAYHQARALIKKSLPGNRDYSDRLFRVADRFSAARKAQKKRLRDDFAESLVTDITGPSPSPQTLKLARTFKAVLAKWKADVTADGRRFLIVVLPRPDDRDVAGKLVGRDPSGVLYLSDFMGDYAAHRFKYDVHWHELGNLAAARVIRSSALFSTYFGEVDPAPLFQDRERAIAEYYRR